MPSVLYCSVEYPVIGASQTTSSTLSVDFEAIATNHIAISSHYIDSEMQLNNNKGALTITKTCLPNVDLCRDTERLSIVTWTPFDRFTQLASWLPVSNTDLETIIFYNYNLQPKRVYKNYENLWLREIIHIML